MHKSSHQLKDGYFVEIDGKFESEYGTFTGALKAGFEAEVSAKSGQSARRK
jgi:hypothetical protein